MEIYQYLIIQIIKKNLTHLSLSKFSFNKHLQMNLLTNKNNKMNSLIVNFPET